MAASSLSAPALSAGQDTKPEYTNWLALGHALTTVLCEGLRPFVNREMKIFYNNVIAGLATAAPCTCAHISRRRPNQYHDMSTCAWANVLQNYHDTNKPNWKQSDSTKWLDPNLGPWEIAKLFLPDLGGHAVINSADDMDVTGILNLMYWCTRFTIPQHLVKDVRDIRNIKWAHVPKLELTDADKTTAFNAIESLLKDPILAHDPDAQRALLEIQTLKCVSDLNNFQAQILTQYKAMIEIDILGLRSDMKKLKKESRRSKKLQKQIKQMEERLRNMQNSLEDANSRISTGRNFGNVVKNSALCMCKYLFKSTRIDKRLLTPWLMVLLLCSMVTILDPRSYKDGCPEEDASVPFETKDINMSEHLIAAQAEDFIGRQWLYREVENMFENDYVSGVLILGNPGAGKSALSSQLICSRTTSSRINSHILGYHFCKYSDKNTQMAGKFVRNVAEMIARRLPEYGYLVSNKSYIQRSFETDCIQNQDPVGCFEQTIVSPLRNLKNKPRQNWYIVLDALDECLSQGETSHSIVYLLNNKIHRFPPWLKLIMTSRNESDASLHSSKINKFVIDPEDSRNIQDIDLFLMERLYQESPLSYWIRSWLGDDSVDSTSKLIKVLLRESQGNFLFVKEVLKHWELSRHELKDAYSLPKTLGDLYYSYFERLYPLSTGEKSFNSARRVLELLVTTFEPLTQKEIFEILRMKEKNLDEEYDFKNRLKKLGHFLKYGENGTVNLYHLSLAEWLTSEGNDRFFVSRRNGHETFCEYYFSLIKGKDRSTLSKYTLILAQHIAYGGWREAYVQEFLGFPSQTVNSSDPFSNRTLLHLAATINSTDVLQLLLQHFSCIDCVDNRGITPAFLAAQHGLVGNLALLLKMGASVNRKTKSIIAMHKDEIREMLQKAKNDSYQFKIPDMEMPVFKTKSKFFGSTMLHAASQRGHINVVNFLLENNAFISTLNDAQLTAIQLAAENGHLEVVKVLREAGANADRTALHQAAANNRLEVVNYLLNIGIEDVCTRCDGSFYWLKTKRRFQSSSLRLFIPLKPNCSAQMHGQVHLNHTFLEFCIDYGQKWEEVNTGELFDDKHLILCHSALHAAVASGHDRIVTRLLSEKNNALTCHDYSGRTPLHEAVRKNDTKIFDILIKTRPQLMHYKCEHWQNIVVTPVAQDECFMSDVVSFDEFREYGTDICHCGYTPLHLAARYGHKNLGISLILQGARVNEGDCNGATPFHVAACHKQVDFISLFSLSEVGGDINRKTKNGSTPLHSAAACGAVDAIDYLLYHKANLTAVDNNGLTALHYSILNVKSSQLDQKVLLNDSCFNDSLKIVTIDRSGHLSTFFEDQHQIKSTDRLHWLDMLLKLVFRGSHIDAVDTSGRTPLHIAAKNGLADAVNVLLLRNATLEKQDRHGKTPMELAVESAVRTPKPLPFFLASHIDDLSRALRDHEMVVYLLLSKGASLRKCNRSEKSLLHRAIVHKQPYIVQLLLLKGATLTCKDNVGRTPLITYLQNGGEWTDVVLRHFNVSIAINCGKPFNSSVFHLLSYLPPTLDNDNFFETKECYQCNDVDCKVRKGPLAKAIESYPNKPIIINSCLDAEGFTPLHRAAQGANVMAVRYLLANGADDSILSPHGHDALTLAVLHAGSIWWPLYGVINSDENLLRIMQASDVAIELLHHAMKTRGYRTACDSTKQELTVYHLAASRGLVKFIEVILKEMQLHNLDVDCSNIDGITPMYLAKLFGDKVHKDLYNPWEHVIQIISNHGGEMKFPRKDAEYTLIYSLIHGFNSIKSSLDSRPDILHFVTSLLTPREKETGNNPFHCNKDQVNVALNYTSNGTSSTSIMLEVLKHMRLSSHDHLRAIEDTAKKSTSFKKRRLITEVFLEERERCFWKGEQFSRYLTRLMLHFKKYHWQIIKRKNSESLYKAQRGWYQEDLLILMLMRHKEIFGIFACIKSLLKRFQTLLDDKTLKALISEYENSLPLFYRNFICLNMLILSSNPSNRVQNLRDLLLFSKHLFRFDFVSERMQKSKGKKSAAHLQNGSDYTALSFEDWPLEFLVTRFLGFLPEYDYLETLFVGMTQVPLYTDEIQRIFDLMKKNVSSIQKEGGR